MMSSSVLIQAVLLSQALEMRLPTDPTAHSIQVANAGTVATAGDSTDKWRDVF